MKNYRSGGSLIILFGLGLFLLAGENWETLAGVVFGAGFGMLIFSFLKRPEKGI